MTAEKFNVYKCDLCGMIVEVLHGGVGHLACCNKNMRLLRENESDGAVEKHVPVIEFIQDGVKVSVGSLPHPMLEEHFIEWIELIAGDKVYRQNLKPGENPEAFFKIGSEVDPKEIVAREYCNLHGLWKKVQ